MVESDATKLKTKLLVVAGFLSLYPGQREVMKEFVGYLKSDKDLSKSEKMRVTLGDKAEPTRLITYESINKKPHIEHYRDLLLVRMDGIVTNDMIKRILNSMLTGEDILVKKQNQSLSSTATLFKATTSIPQKIESPYGSIPDLVGTPATKAELLQMVSGILSDWTHPQSSFRHCKYRQDAIDVLSILNFGVMPDYEKRGQSMAFKGARIWMDFERALRTYIFSNKDEDNPVRQLCALIKDPNLTTFKLSAFKEKIKNTDFSYAMDPSVSQKPDADPASSSDDVSKSATFIRK